MSSNFFVFGLVVILALGLGIVFLHEQVHVFINNGTGQDSRIVFGVYDGFIPFVGVEKTGAVERDLTNAEIAHSFNESINYNLTPLLFGLMLLTVMGFSEVLKKMDVKK